jgi:two-component system chemotaxis response regulator CheY
VSLNILVVDDSAVMRAMIIRTLRLSGVPVGELVEAGNGLEAVERVADHWVDLMLLDINMPVMDGQAVIERMRADPLTESLPIIVVSTERSETRVAALRALGVEFVHKPFTPEQLRDTIIRITGVTTDVHAHGAATLPSGDFDF